jgi:hypothetical protein
MPDLDWPEVAVLQDEYSVSFAVTIVDKQCHLLQGAIRKRANEGYQPIR